MDHDPMKLFGGQREPAAPAPAPITDAAPAPPSLFRSRGFRRLLSAGVLLLVLACCVVGYTRANNYGTRIVQARPVDARIEITNPPAWLDRRIVAALLNEAYQFAQKDKATYDRSRNTLDGGIMHEFADLYTGSSPEGSRQAVGFNAWIKSITEVQREVARDKSVQTIQISAEWRTPAAWVRVGDRLCLVDADGIRLPGDYNVADRRSSLLAISGLDFPRTAQDIPQPGEKWAAGGAALAPDFAAGMNLAKTLQHQPFGAQIREINLANYAGRVSPSACWIYFDTTFDSAVAGGPGPATRIEWGRPIGEEKYYEVQSAVKIKTLNELFTRFSRIDAGREYVDIRTEVVRLPKLAMAGN